jgi:hypothetical protein
MAPWSRSKRRRRKARKHVRARERREGVPGESEEFVRTELVTPFRLPRSKSPNNVGTQYKYMGLLVPGGNLTYVPER